MIKVLQITGQLARNGTETFIMNVFRNINRQKIMFDFLLFTQAIENGYYQEAESLGAKIYRLPERKSGVVKYWRALDRFFKEHAREYDAVHFNGNSFTSVTAVYYAKKYKIPIRIVHSHNSSTRGFHNKILHKLNKLFIHKIATDYLACSDRAAIWAYGNTVLVFLFSFIFSFIVLVFASYFNFMTYHKACTLHKTGTVSEFLNTVPKSSFKNVYIIRIYLLVS